MGVTGLIKFVEKATTPSNVSSMRGSTVAIDSYYLLHKGSYSCADRLVQGIKTNAMVSYAMKYVRLLINHRIKVIMVFDGKSLKAKAKTNEKRRLNRDIAKSKATDLLREGNVEQARKEFTKAVNITHAHALELMEECRKLGVNCIVAMYEADAQLAYLNKIGLAEYVISEDSDLILFGCKKIVYKLALDETCRIFDSNNLHLTLSKSKEDFSFKTFRRICILSGCDYVDSLPGVGLQKAIKFFEMTAETDMQIALFRIPAYLKLKNVTVDQEYIDNFLIAEATFKYMYVFDPIKTKMVRLNDLESDNDLKHCANAGELLDDETAYQLALGNLNPKTMARVNCFDPFKQATATSFSIWKSNSEKVVNCKPQAAKKQIGMFFFKKLEPPRPEVLEIIETENKIDAVVMDDLISSYYGDNDNNCSISQSWEAKNSSKRSYTEVETEDEKIVEITASQHNPFVKKRKSMGQHEADNLSLLRNLKETPATNGSRVVSRFFQPKSTAPSLCELETNKKLDTNRRFYALTKGIRKRKQHNGEFTMNLRDLIIGEDSSYQYDKEANTYTHIDAHKRSPENTILAYDKWCLSRDSKSIVIKRKRGRESQHDESNINFIITIAEISMMDKYQLIEPFYEKRNVKMISELIAIADDEATPQSDLFEVVNTLARAESSSDSISTVEELFDLPSSDSCSDDVACGNDEFQMILGEEPISHDNRCVPPAKMHLITIAQLTSLADSNPTMVSKADETEHTVIFDENEDIDREDHEDERERQKASSYAILSEMKKQANVLKFSSQPVAPKPAKRLPPKSRKTSSTQVSASVQSKLSKFGFIKQKSL